MRNLKIVLLLISAGLVVALTTWRAVPAVDHWWKQTNHPISQQAAVPSIRYPYSVIAGGVQTKKDVLRNEQNDPVVAKHYQDFNDVFVFYRNPKELRGFVSYRIGNSIYWTHHRVTIPAGELLFTNGSLLARARCGNRISLTEQAPVEELPTVAEGTLDQPYLMEPERVSFGFAPVAFGNDILPSALDNGSGNSIPMGAGQPKSQEVGQPLFSPWSMARWIPYGMIEQPLICGAGETLITRTVHGKQVTFCHTDGNPSGTPIPPVTPIIPVTPTPEPGPAALIGCGLCLLAVGVSVARSHR